MVLYMNRLSRVMTLNGRVIREITSKGASKDGQAVKMGW